MGEIGVANPVLDYRSAARSRPPTSAGMSAGPAFECDLACSTPDTLWGIFLDAIGRAQRTLEGTSREKSAA